MKKILVTGLCTLHWGRLQFGNIGNYYIIEPLFRQLHRVFPETEIWTTFQMTDEFVKKEQVTVLPMELYYAWTGEDLNIAKNEYSLAKRYGNCIPEAEKSEYIKCVDECDMVINVSGDMWGDNAEHVGQGRFLVDLYKMRTVQLIGKKTVLFAGTPGPFTDADICSFAKEVYSKFSLVINREPTSTSNLKEWGFNSNLVKDFACPAFIYQPKLTKQEEDEKNELIYQLKGNEGEILIGFTIGGFNMPVGPYDMWPREECQYRVFVEAIEYIVNQLNAKVVLFSHTNGFDLPPDFKLINGRDYPILKQLEEIIINRGLVQKNKIACIDKPYLPHMIKSIIGDFDMVVTGRVHASVAAISQYVPTVFLTYEKNFIPSTKMYGFSALAGVGELVCEPGDLEGMIEKISYCFNNRLEVKNRLKNNIPEVKELAISAFDAIANI